MALDRQPDWLFDCTMLGRDLCSVFQHDTTAVMFLQPMISPSCKYTMSFVDITGVVCGVSVCVRLMADESAATEQVAHSFNIVEVPTFIFLRNGREVARHVGSSRGDLIGRILQVLLGGAGRGGTGHGDGYWGASLHGVLHWIECCGSGGPPSTCSDICS